MKKTSQIVLIMLLAGMVAVSGCNKKNRKAEGADMGDGVSASGTGTEFGPDGRPLGDWQDGGTGDLLSRTTIYFAYDSSELDSESQAIAEAHATLLRDNSSMQVVLEGHADERGTREYNLGLGERRGNAVSGLMSAQGGRGNQLATVSYGEERPTCRVSDEDCWSMNRRVEIVYTSR